MNYYIGRREGKEDFSSPKYFTKHEDAVKDAIKHCDKTFKNQPLNNKKNKMKTTTKPLWGIQTTIKDSGKKVLAWHYRGGKSLYWTADEKSVPPALFETKSEALGAIKRAGKSRENMSKILFKNVYVDAVKETKPVKIKIQILN